MKRRFGEASHANAAGSSQTREQLLTMLHELAVYPDTVNRNALPDEHDNRDKTKRKSESKSFVSSTGTESKNATAPSTPAAGATQPPVPTYAPTPSSTPSSAHSANAVVPVGHQPSWSNYHASLPPSPYNQNSYSSYNQRPKRNETAKKGTERMKQSSPHSSLPRNVLFQIPAGRVDIRSAVAQLIDDYHNCRICLTLCNVPSNPNTNVQPHVTSECPLLPNDPAARYEALAGRLNNLATFREWVQKGMHPSLEEPPKAPTPPNVPLIAPAPPSILRRPNNESNQSN